MKGKSPILTLVSVVLVLFLFAPVLLRTINAVSEANFKHISITPVSGTPSKLDAQLPFEEREKEEEAVSHGLPELPLLAVIYEPLFPEQSFLLKFHPCQVSLKCEHQPRYLLIRSLLI